MVLEKYTKFEEMNGWTRGYSNFQQTLKTKLALKRFGLCFRKYFIQKGDLKRHYRSSKLFC